MSKLRGNVARKQLRKAQSGVADKSERLASELALSIPGFVLADIDHSDSDRREIACLLLCNLFDHDHQPDKHIIDLLVGNSVGKKLCGRMLDSSLDVRLYAAGALRNMSSSGSAVFCTSLFRDGVLNAAHASLQQLTECSTENMETHCSIAEQMLSVIVGICEMAESAARAVMNDRDLTDGLKKFCTLRGFHQQLTPLAVNALYTCCDDNRDFIQHLSQDDVSDMLELFGAKNLEYSSNINLAGVILNAVLLNDDIDQDRKGELIGNVLNDLIPYLNIEVELVSSKLSLQLQPNNDSDNSNTVIDDGSDCAVAQLNACSSCIELFINFQSNPLLLQRLVAFNCDSYICDQLLDHCLNWLSSFADSTNNNVSLLSSCLLLSDRIWSCCTNVNQMNGIVMEDKVKRYLETVARIPIDDDDDGKRMMIHRLSDLMSTLLNYCLMTSLDVMNCIHIIQFAVDICKSSSSSPSGLKVSLAHMTATAIPTATSYDDIHFLSSAFLVLMDSSEIEALHVAINYFIDLHSGDDGIRYQVYVDLDMSSNLDQVKKNLAGLIGDDNADEYSETLVNLNNFIEYKQHPSY